jgi:class 3 adenylate cyclase
MSSSENLKKGERRIVTVVFADMKNFSGLTGELDPEEMDVMMSEIFSDFSNIVNRYGGTVEKYIGDALVAVFGIPEIHEDDACRAVHAALDFEEKAVGLNADRPGGDRIEFRIGIHTGLITTGRRGQFEVVTGATMVLASRLQEAAAPGRILLSAATKERCEPDFLFGEVLSVNLKGSEETVTAYPVSGRNADPFRDNSVFIGREELVDRILAAYMRHAPERTEGFYLTGEPGIGKTRIATKFIEKIRRFPDFDAPLLFAGTKRYRHSPFALITDLLCNYFRINYRDDAPTVLAKIQKKIETDQKTAGDFYLMLRPNRETQRGSEAFVHLYLLLKQIICERRESPFPVLIFIDDIHNIDTESSDFFAFFLKNATVKPYFVLCGRGREESIRDVFSGLETVKVEAFEREESEQLIKALWPESEGRPVFEEIRRNAMGNPLFIKEFVNYAKQSGGDGSLPTTIQNMFLSSISSYIPERRELLKKLSVFVRNFTLEDSEELHEKTEGDPGNVSDALAFFIEEGILREENGVYFFRYEVFKKALYNSLLNFNKKILHRLVAARMKRCEASDQPRFLHHLSMAEEYEKIKEQLFSRDENYFSDMAFMPYVDLLLEHSDKHDHETVVRCLFMKSALYFNNGYTGEAEHVMQDIIHVAISEKKPIYMANAYHILTARSMKAYSFQKTVFFARKAFAGYEDFPEYPGPRQNVLSILAVSEILHNRLDEAEKLINEIRGMENHYRGFLADLESDFMVMTGDYRGSLARLEEEMERNDEKGPALRSSLQYGLLYTQWCRCDFRALDAAARDYIDSEQPSSPKNSQAHAYRAVALHMLGEDERVDSLLKQADFLLAGIRNEYDLLDAQRTLALASYLSGDAEKAEAEACAALSIGLRHAAFYPTFTLLILLVELYRRQGKEREAEFFLAEAEFHVSAGVLLSNRDLILYFWYKSLIEARETAEMYRHEAYERLGLELERIDEAYHPVFLAMREYGTIQKMMEEEHDQSGISTAG